MFPLSKCINNFIKTFLILNLSWMVSIAQAGVNVTSSLEASKWKEIKFKGEAPNIFTSCGEGCVKIHTNKSVSMVAREVDIDLEEAPILSWEWRIEKATTFSDLSIKGKDDRAVALYVAFPYNSEHSSFAERLLRPFVELHRGPNAPGRVISYVWSGFGRRHQVVESPYLSPAGAIIILRNQSAKPGEWLRERVDVVSDYQRIFGIKPNMANYILISSDSDDTGTSNQASIRSIEFSNRIN